MKLSRVLIIALVVLTAQISVWSAELAVLRNGRSIQHQRREQIGDVTRLYTASGYLDVATDSIASFEKEEEPLVVPTSTAPAQPEPTTSSQIQPKRGPAASNVDLDQLIRDASGKRQIDPDFVNSVIKAESNFHPRAVSPKGAQGLMQLMPGTANKLGVKDPFDPKDNLEAGTAYLRELLTLYDNDPIKALAAYNAGAHRVQQYHGVPPYRETRAYITRIVRDFNAKKLAQMKVAGQTPRPANTNSKKGTTQPVKKPASQQASVAGQQSPPDAE